MGIQKTLGFDYWSDIASGMDMHLAAIFLEQLGCYTPEAGEAATRVLLDLDYNNTFSPDVILATTKVLASHGAQKCSSSACSCEHAEPIAPQAEPSVVEERVEE